MKFVLALVFLLSQLYGYAQEKYITKTATINFVGSVDSFEPIKAINNSATVVLSDEGGLAALVLVKGFKFPVALMQEHFNENYIESDDYPKAVLRGALKDYVISTDDKVSTTYTFLGDLEMHGVKKQVEFPVQITNNNSSTFDLSSKFTIDPTEFNIKIPSVVRKKIAEKIRIEVKATLVKN